LYFHLRGLSWVEDELSEISLINQILEVPSQGPTFDGGMAHPVMEGALVLESVFLRVLPERSGGTPDPGLVF